MGTPSAGRVCDIGDRDVGFPGHRIHIAHGKLHQRRFAACREWNAVQWPLCRTRLRDRDWCFFKDSVRVRTTEAK